MLLGTSHSAGGRDSIDHPSGQHDDLANAIAGAIVTAVRRSNLKETPICAPIVVSAGPRDFPGGVKRLHAYRA